MIVNCTGYNAVDLAEDHPVDALTVNAFAARNLRGAEGRSRRRWCTTAATSSSTARPNRPHREEDRPNPRSTYAASKMLGDGSPRMRRTTSCESRACSACQGCAAAEGYCGGDRGGSLLAGTPVTVFSDGAGIADLRVRRCATLTHPRARGGFRAVPWRELRAYHLEHFAREAAKLLAVDAHLKVVSAATLSSRRHGRATARCRTPTSAAVEMLTWQEALARHLAQELRTGNGGTEKYNLAIVTCCEISGRAGLALRPA